MNEQKTKAELIEEIIKLKASQRNKLIEFRFAKLMQEVFAEHGISAIDEQEMIELDKSTLELEEYEDLANYYNDLLDTCEDCDEIYRGWSKLNDYYKDKSDDEIKSMINKYFDEYPTVNEAAATFLMELGQEAVELMD